MNQKEHLQIKPTQNPLFISRGGFKIPHGIVIEKTAENITEVYKQFFSLRHSD